MAKKREWKAWMVISGPNDSPVKYGNGQLVIHTDRKTSRSDVSAGERIIRVRITEVK